ncbi:MAG: hypothetical protein H6819_05960 [Phycisphaerales bacterium]|nr:hypothetical protein [Phycisphaerales bacterium]MCB9858634.1 hypothetical protein [Phycisphaerales bacterium]
MLFLSASIWVLMIVVLAWAVDYQWSRMLKPRYVNIALLPGTLVATLGRIIGLLITGAKVNNTALMGDDERGAPLSDAAYEPKIPVFGPVLIGFLPLVACGTAIYLVVNHLGEPIAQKVPIEKIAAETPDSLGAFWSQSRSLIDLAEGTCNAIRTADYDRWQTWAFVYLLMCLAVRSAPFPGNVKGHFVAILAAGGIVWLMGTISPAPGLLIEQSWPVLAVTIGWLLLLLIISLIARGVFEIVKGLARAG